MKKTKKLRRKEYQVSTHFSCGMDINVMARTHEEAKSIASHILHDIVLPKSSGAKIGKRWRRLVDCKDYILECNSAPKVDWETVDLADDKHKILT